MDVTFWRDKWQTNDIAFHAEEANPLLVKYFNRLSTVEGSRVFVPLCGKTLDIPWLLSQGCRVAGAELSTIAVDQLFAGLEIDPTITRIGEIDHYSANSLDIYVGDVFFMSRELLGKVDAIYDRAALVALPEKMRDRYAAHLMEITDNAQQLLICYEYDQNLMQGPPFSISRDELNEHYGDDYDMSLLASTDVPGGLKGICAAKESVWLLMDK